MGNPERRAFKHDGRTIFEWEQTLEEVNVYIMPPAGLSKAMFDIIIQSDHIRIGIKGNPPFLSEELFATIVKSESYWMLDDGELNINLQKSMRGETWPSVFKGKGIMSAVEVEKEKQNILLERFGTEHPGFDFSNAEVSGQVPDARKFMGGLDYSKMK